MEMRVLRPDRGRSCHSRRCKSLLDRCWRRSDLELRLGRHGCREESVMMMKMLMMQTMASGLDMGLNLRTGPAQRSKGMKVKLIGSVSRCSANGKVAGMIRRKRGCG